MVFDDVQREHSYRENLDILEKERQEARKAWKTIHNIKELKSGYLSQVVHQISKLAVEHNAIIVLEDLNFGFKRGRFKVEKQVYQKFEKMLIDKLNYMLFKERVPANPGGILRAYQLTSKFKSSKELGKQTGLLYYVDANYTSKICPKTGFVNLLYPKYTNVNSAKEFFEKFESIRYNKKENYFEFIFKYANFTKHDKKSDYDDKEWTVCSFGTRFVTKHNESTKIYETIELNPTDELRKLFVENDILFEEGENIKRKICSKEDKTFFDRLLSFLKVTLQLRNTNTKNNDDFILSCVKDEFCAFFDSRKAKNGEPENADANGAYHIGLKGLLTIKKIKNGDAEIYVDKNDYLTFAMRKQWKKT